MLFTTYPSRTSVNDSLNIQFPLSLFTFLIKYDTFKTSAPRHPMPKALSASKIASFLHLHPNTLYRLLSTKSLNLHVPKRGVLFPTSNPSIWLDREICRQTKSRQMYLPFYKQNRDLVDFLDSFRYRGTDGKRQNPPHEAVDTRTREAWKRDLYSNPRLAVPPQGNSIRPEILDVRDCKAFGNLYALSKMVRVRKDAPRMTSSRRNPKEAISL